MKKKLILALILVMSLSINAYALSDFTKDLLKTVVQTKAEEKTSTVNKTAMLKEINSLKATVEKVNNYYNNSVFNLSSIVLSDTDIKALKTSKTTLAKKYTTTATLNNALAQEAQEKLIASLKKNETVSKIKALPTAKKTVIENSIYNIGLANLNYVNAGKSSLNLLKQIAKDPATALSLSNEIGSLKTLSKTAAQQAKAANLILTTVTKTSGSTGIDISRPQSAASAAKTLADITF